MDLNLKLPKMVHIYMVYSLKEQNGMKRII